MDGVAKPDGALHCGRVLGAVHSMPRLLIEQAHDAPAALIRLKKGDDHLARVAMLAAQTLSNLHEWKIISEHCAKSRQRKARAVLALAAIRPVVVRIIDVGERCGFELCVRHTSTLAEAACEHPWDNSYSSEGSRTLYIDGLSTG